MDNTTIQLYMLYTTVAIAIFTAFAVVSAAVSSHMARQTVDKTHKNTQAQVVISLLDAYGSEEMRQSLKGLEDKWEENQSHYKERFREQRETNPNWDSWRRHVAHYYHKVAVLYERGLLDKKYAVVVATKGQVEFLVKIIEPLEIGIAEEYGHFMFDVLQALYDEELAKKLRTKGYNLPK